MKVVLFAEVACDDCPKALRRQALPGTEATPLAAKRLTRSLEAAAVARGWRMEGPSVHAGDLCPACLCSEQIAMGVSTRGGGVRYELW